MIIWLSIYSIHLEYSQIDEMRRYHWVATHKLWPKLRREGGIKYNLKSAKGRQCGRQNYVSQWDASKTFLYDATAYQMFFLQMAYL